MTRFIISLAIATALTTITPAFAQPQARAENNDVFYKDKDGKSRVLAPPSPIGQQRPSSPRPLSTGKLPAVYMFETEDGVVECSDLWRTTCQRSTYGSETRGRWWIVRRGGYWRQCNGPEASAQCNLVGAFNGTKGNDDMFDPRVKWAPERVH
jgi:hypothetical protein